MTNRELLCFVNKFRQLMSAGNSAKLVMDCESGCVRVILDVILQPANHPHQQPHHQAQAQRRAACPARQRRRVRRAQAREAAAHQAETEQVRPAIHAAVQGADSHYHPHPGLGGGGVVSHPPPGPDGGGAVPHPPLGPGGGGAVPNPPQHLSVHSTQDPFQAEEALHHHHLHQAGEVYHLPHQAAEVRHQYASHQAEEVQHHQHPHQAEEVRPNHPPHQAEEVQHQHPPYQAEEAINHHDVIPPLGGSAAESFPPPSYRTSPKEVFPPAAVPLLQPGHYQEDDAQGDVEAPHVHLQVQPDHHLPYPPLSHPSVSPPCPAYCHPQSQQLSALMMPAGQQSVDQGELDSDQKKKKRRRKKRKSKSKTDETEFDDEIIPGGPGTPTVVMKGWGALLAYGKLTE